MPWGRQKTGSVVCRSCGLLVGVNDEECYHCGARNPALWGFAPWLRGLGADLGFIGTIIDNQADLHIAFTHGAG